MPKVIDPVAMRSPRGVVKVVSRRDVPARKRRGWTVDQVSTPPVDESPTGDEPQPPSKED